MGFGCGESELGMWGWGLGIGVWSVLSLAHLRFEAISIYPSFHRSIDLCIHVSIYPSIYTKICIHMETVLFSNTLLLSQVWMKWHGEVAVKLSRGHASKTPHATRHTAFKIITELNAIEWIYIK